MATKAKAMRLAQQLIETLDGDGWEPFLFKECAAFGWWFHITRGPLTVCVVGGVDGLRFHCPPFAYYAKLGAWNGYDRYYTDPNGAVAARVAQIQSHIDSLQALIDSAYTGK